MVTMGERLGGWVGRVMGIKGHKNSYVLKFQGKNVFYITCQIFSKIHLLEKKKDMTEMKFIYSFIQLILLK